MSNLPQLAAEIEKVLVSGDLKALTPEKRVSYYNAVCSSLKLNPLTKPFDYIDLDGRLTLYTRKDATDQLRRQWDVSIKITSREKLGDVYVVTAQAKLLDRVDEAIGAVPINGLRGKYLANALMKAETKAKRRVTLSICGLGMTDESELETIKNVNVKQYKQELVSMETLLETPPTPVQEEEANDPSETPPDGDRKVTVDPDLPSHVETPGEEKRIEKEVQHVETPDENTVDVKASKSEGETPFDALPEDPEDEEDKSKIGSLVEPDFEGELEKEKNSVPNAAELVKVTEAQCKRMLGISRQQGWKDKEIYSLIRKMCGHEKLRNMNQSEYNFIISFVNDNKPEVLET